MQFGRRSISILHIDDERLDQIILQRALEKKGLDIKIRCVDDGEQAIAVLEDQEYINSIPGPLLVFLDLHMPKVSGLTVLQSIREHEQLKRTPVFILTNSGRDSEIKTAYEIGATGYIRKEDAGSGFGRLADLIDDFSSTVSFAPLD